MLLEHNSLYFLYPQSPPFRSPRWGVSTPHLSPKDPLHSDPENELISNSDRKKLILQSDLTSALCPFPLCVAFWYCIGILFEMQINICIIIYYILWYFNMLSIFKETEKKLPQIFVLCQKVKIFSQHCYCEKWHNEQSQLEINNTQIHTGGFRHQNKHRFQKTGETRTKHHDINIPKATFFFGASNNFLPEFTPIRDYPQFFPPPSKKIRNAPC